MSKLIPDYVFDSIYDITPEVLTAHGVRGVLVDLDGTMACPQGCFAARYAAPLCRSAEDAGIAVLVFSNNHPERVGKFCEPLGVGYISHAGKPFSRGFRKAANRLGLSMREIAVIGDQIFTDVFGGNRAGALTCYVETLDRRFFWINVRYQLERGFIARGRRRMEARAHHAEPKFGPGGQLGVVCRRRLQEKRGCACMARTDGTDRV